MRRNTSEAVRFQIGFSIQSLMTHFMKATILCLYDEGAVEGTPLIGARGFSLLINVDGEQTMFDTGLRGRYLMNNMKVLKVVPEKIKRVIISHGHSDHVGGLRKLNDSRTEYLKVFSDQKTFETRTGIRGSPVFKGLTKIAHEHVEGWVRLSEHLYIAPPISGEHSECSAVLLTKRGPVLICGCCHDGIGQRMDQVEDMLGRQPTSIVGGLHLSGSGHQRIGRTLEDLESRSSPHIYTGHCTEPNGMTKLRTRFGLRAVSDLYAGTEIRFDLSHENSKNNGL